MSTNRQFFYCDIKIILVIVICLGYFRTAAQVIDSTSPKPLSVKQKSDSVKKAEDSKKLTQVATTADEKKISILPIVVENVYKYGRADSSDFRAGIGDIIIVEVQNLDSLLKRSLALKQDICLYINGRKIDNIKPISGAPDKEKGELQYRLDRNSGNDKTFADILGAPALFSNEFFDTDVKVSVGLANEFAVDTSSTKNNFTLIRIHKGWFWICGFLITLYLIIVVYMARSSGLLRDRAIDLSAVGITNNRPTNTYSLARFQMAFWFTLTLVSFLFIWLITDAYDIITPTILALIGISAGTSLSATVIDNSKATDLLNQTIAFQDERNDLKINITSLNQQVASNPPPVNLNNLITEINTKGNRIVEIDEVIERNKQNLKPQVSLGFFNDLLKDVNGVSFHRLQMLVWTIVLGLIFLYSVWKRLAMPEFGTTLLALQGLTSGTYLGFKFPEK
ncbi:MAG: hypothetical protein ABI402_14235 [Ferruginibacter sp.]